jgi:hypothetical protein
MIKRNGLIILLILAACSRKTEVVQSVAEQKKHVDSLLQIQIKEIEAEHAERLKDRISIELKMRIDSIAQAHLQQHNAIKAKDSLSQLSDSTHISTLDTTKHL